MDITALLTTSAGKTAHPQAAGKPPIDGAFAEQLNLAAHTAGLAQLLGPDHAKPAAMKDAGLPSELPAELAALAERISDELPDSADQEQALALIESVLDEANGETLGKAPLAALEALLDDQRQPADSVSLDRGEESALLAEVRQRMALIDAAGRTLAEPDKGPARPQPGAEPVVLQAPPRGFAQPPGDARPQHAASEALLLDPAAAREVKPSGRETLAEITQQALRSANQAAPAAAAPSPQTAATGQPQPGSDAPLLASVNARSEAPSAASGESHGVPSATTSSAQGTTASPAPTGQPLASPNAAALSAPVASQQWQQQLGQQLVNLTQRGDQRVELRLNPAELGPLSVSLKLGESGAQAQFLSAHAQVRAAVEQAIPQLREALEQQGISLSEASVGEHGNGRQDGMQFANSGNGSANGGQQNGTQGGSAEDQTPIEAAQPLDLDGRVDLYA